MVTHVTISSVFAHILETCVLGNSVRGTAMLFFKTVRANIRRVVVGAMILSLIAPDRALSYQTSLDPKTIEAAYSLGQRNDRATADFLARYIWQATAEGANGLHRADVEVLTPFVQIVDRARDNSRGYSLEQATADYHTRGDSIVIRVSLVLPANYPAPTGSTVAPCDNNELLPQNFWKNFAFIVKQRGKRIEARSVRNEPIYSAASNDRPSRLDGADVFLEFDAKNVTSETIAVDIVTPRCATITATFDLARLQ